MATPAAIIYLQPTLTLTNIRWEISISSYLTTKYVIAFGVVNASNRNRVTK